MVSSLVRGCTIARLLHGELVKFVSRIDPLKEPHKGSIEWITSEQINIAFDEVFEDLDDGFWR